MTLHAFSKKSGKSERWVAVPLELVDWMKERFSGAFINYLGTIDPYESVLIPEDIVANAADELRNVRECLSRHRVNDVPERVDIFGDYGKKGAVRTADEMVEFFEFVGCGDYKIVSIGD